MSLTTVRKLRQALAEVYYYTTYPERRWYHRRLVAAGRAPVSVLTFHRIADDRANRWTTHTRDFFEVIRWLQPRFHFVSLPELQEHVRGRACPQPAVCITFDDGYADNCRDALPLLIAEKIPCAYFVTADAVLNGKPFEHDVEMGNRHLTLNTVDQLRAMSDQGVEIGAHTRTHPDLGRVTDARRLHDEIVASREDLEAAIGKRIRYFAFPFGSPENLTVGAFHAAKAAGYSGVCSAYGGWNYPGDNPFHIRRRCVDGPPNRAKNWSMIDPFREWYLPHFALPRNGALSNW